MMRNLGKKPIVVELKVKLVYFNNTDDEDGVRFWIEENHCLSNVIDALAKDSEQDDKHHVCSLCASAEAKFIRFASEEDIRSMSPPADELAG